MFAQDARHPTGESLFTDACPALGLDSAGITKVMAAFTTGRTFKQVAVAGTDAPSKEEAEVPSDEAQESDVESSGIGDLLHQMSGLPALIPLKPRAGTSSSSSSSSSSS